jgi:small subunit ribosomal protein S2
MTRLPGAIFIVDTTREHIAVKEAQKLKIPIFAMVDTNSDPRDVEYVIPSNDDASKSIEKILSLVTEAVKEGLNDRKNEKEGNAENDAAQMEAVAKADEVTAIEEKGTEEVAEVTSAEEKSVAEKEATTKEDKKEA